MPRLIHLNGPSRVGKSTLARRYADDHPGTLVLDLDVLVGLVGGWKRDFSAALEVARELGREMAALHLRAGHDVVFPQLVTVHDRAPDPALEGVALATGSVYVEVALVIDRDEHRQRLRDKRTATEVEGHLQAVLEDPSSDLMDRVQRHLAEYLALRPQAFQIDTSGLAENASYMRLLDVLDSGIGTPCASAEQLP